MHSTGIIIIGQVGCGKSSFGNVLLRKSSFGNEGLDRDSTGISSFGNEGLDRDSTGISSFGNEGLDRDSTGISSFGNVWLIEMRTNEVFIAKDDIEKMYYLDPVFYNDLHPASFGYGSSGKGRQYYDPSVAYMQQQRILKTTGLLKEELDWPGISLIAGSLQKDGYITHDELEQIMDKSQPRRKAVDMLLKVVLGNLPTVSAFMRILNSESDLSYVAGRINRTQLPAKELNNPTWNKRSERGMLVCQEVKPIQRLKRLKRKQKGSVSDAVKKIVSILRTATAKQKLRSHASKHLNLELKEAFMESFGIMFTFKIEDQSQKLKDPLPTGSDSTLL